MNRIQLDKDKSERLFNEIKRLSQSVENLASIFQNPDFSHPEDLSIFKDMCANFECDYLKLKREVIEMFGILKK